MDWLKSVAPIIAAALGSPVAGIAVNFLADKLGVEEKTVDAVKAAIAGTTPEQMLQIKQLDVDLDKYLASLNIDLEKIAAADRDSARNREIKTGDSATPRALALIFVVGYFAVQWYLLTHVVPQEMREIVVRTLGTLDLAIGLILGYYFGSTKGSAEKTAMIARVKEQLGS